jgi:hypothetical protein
VIDTHRFILCVRLVQASAAARASAAAAAVSSAAAVEEGVQYRCFAKRSTRYTIVDPNRSVVGFSQVTTLSDCAAGGVYSPEEDFGLSSRPASSPSKHLTRADVLDDLVVGCVFRVIPVPLPQWLSLTRYM